MDCVSECGFGCFISIKNFLNYHLALLSLVAFFLAILGTISYSDIAFGVGNAPWMHGSINGVYEFMFGLKSVAGKEPDLTVYSSTVYNSPDCQESFCKVCGKAGRSVVGCLIVALVFLFFSFLISLKRTFGDSGVWKILAFLTSGVAFAFGCAAYNTHRPCYFEVRDWLSTSVAEISQQNSHDFSYSYGYDSGAKEALTAFILAIYIAFFNLLIPVATATADAK